MNLSQIVVLLQLVLTLLSNPQTAQNPQVQALATQAIQSASQALQVQVAPIQPPVVVPETPAVIETPAEVQSTSCTLTSESQSAPGLQLSSVVDLSWTLSGIPESTVGILYGLQGNQLGRLQVQDSGPYPHQMKTRTHYQEGGFEADFNGTVCYAYFYGGK